MSELGRLFRRGGMGLEQRENFTTEALAIAIHRDPRPMALALKAMSWPLAGGGTQGTVHRLIAITSQGCSMSVQTQQWLPRSANGLELGYLDMVLRLSLTAGVDSVEVWVEVKVDAPESGQQLANYTAHASTRPADARPIIVTLARSGLRSDYPSFLWDDIVDAVDALGKTETPPHYTWLALREFLLDERIASQKLPEAPLVDRGALLEVILRVNDLIRERWKGTPIAWQDGHLRTAMHGVFEPSHGAETTGGPLRYGVIAEGTRWEWGLTVSTWNHQRVKVGADDFKRRADGSGLLADWRRLNGSRDALTRRLAYRQGDSSAIVVDWFRESLKQLDDAQVLEPFFEGLAAKAALAAAKTLGTDRDDSASETNGVNEASE
jgi:hypothetical protein